MALKLSTMMAMMVVVVVLALLSSTGEGAPLQGGAAGRGPAPHWKHWQLLQLQRRTQQQLAQQQRMNRQRAVHRGGDWSILTAREQQLLKEQLAEEQMERQEEMQDIISNNMLDEFSMHMIQDTIGRILEPLVSEVPAQRVKPCTTRTAPVSFLELQLPGYFSYTVCGSGDGVAMHLHFQKQGATTPSLDTTTTPLATSPNPPTTTAAPPPPCPTDPTPAQTTQPPQTTPEPETTTTSQAEVTTTAAPQ